MNSTEHGDVNEGHLNWQSQAVCSPCRDHAMEIKHDPTLHQKVPNSEKNPSHSAVCGYYIPDHLTDGIKGSNVSEHRSRAEKCSFGATIGNQRMDHSPDHREINHHGTSHHGMSHHGIGVIVTNFDEHESSSMVRDQTDELLSHKMHNLTMCMSAPALQDRRNRYSHRSGGWQPPTASERSPTDTGSPRPKLHISRDHIQPAAGSLHDLHILSPTAGLGEDEEELDELLPLPRPRASTCPETKAFRRKLRAKMLNRPLTPPPGDCVVMRIGSRDGSEGSIERVGEENEMEVEGSGLYMTEDWSLRSLSDSCAPDLPVIEEAG
jgi:hypothetical protein